MSQTNDSIEYSEPTCLSEVENKQSDLFHIINFI